MKIELFCANSYSLVAKLDTAKIYPEWLRVDAGAEYSAKACLENGEITEWERLDCVLQVGHDSDVVAVLYDNKDFVTFYTDKENRTHHRVRFKLFSQTLGASRLFFSCENNGRYEEYCLANVWVDNGEKKDLYDKMVEQLVSCEMPQYVVTHFKWQMQYHKFRLGWKEGYATYIDDDMMLEELEVLTKDIRKCLKVITLRPYEQIRNEEGHSYVSKLKKLDTRGRRAIEKNQLLKWSCECKVLAQKKVVSFDCIAHDVFKTFLLEYLARIVIICENFQKKINERLEKLNKEARKKTSWKVTLKKEVSEFENRLQRAVRLKDVFNKCLKLPILMKSWKRVTIFEVSSSAFMINFGYYNLYKVMLDFSRKSFWWDKDRDLPWKRYPKLELDEINGVPRLQFKYSITYENWVIAQFCLALDRLGYGITKKVNERDNQCRYKFTKRGVVVEVVHGVVAHKSGRFFSYQTYTPDFAIIISRENSSEIAWALADAKSSGRLGGKETGIYTKYGGVECKVEGNKKVKPFACVIVLSGEMETDYNGVIFPCPYVNKMEKESWAEHDKGYTWERDVGIKWHGEDATFARGVIYMNVGSPNVEENVSMFMDGLIQTALRILDSES